MSQPVDDTEKMSKKLGISIDYRQPQAVLANATFLQQKAAARVILPAGRGLDDGHALVKLQGMLSQWLRSPDVYAVILQSGLIGDRPDLPLDAEPSTVSAAEMGPVGAGLPALKQLFAASWQIECSPKPMVALLDGLMTGPNLALSSFGTHRVASESYQLLLPPPRDHDAFKPASLPLGGIAHVLARVPRGRGYEWALTGRAVGRAEAWAAGLLTHCIPAAAFPSIVAALADGQPVDPLLDGLHRDPTVGEVRSSDVPDDAGVERCFYTTPFAGIALALSRETGLYRPWANAARAGFDQHVPLHLAAMHRLLDLSRGPSLRDSLIYTYRLAAGLMAPDLQHEDPGATLERLFLTPAGGDVVLPARREIAAMKV